MSANRPSSGPARVAPRSSAHKSGLSSSSGIHIHQSDENAISTRTVLGEIKNIVDNGTASRIRRSTRRPLSDRNATPESQLRSEPGILDNRAPALRSTPSYRDSPIPASAPQNNTARSSRLGPNRKKSAKASSATRGRQVATHPSSSALEVFSHVEIPSEPASHDLPRPSTSRGKPAAPKSLAKIPASQPPPRAKEARRFAEILPPATAPAPAAASARRRHEPDTDSDNLEYIELPGLHSTRSAQRSSVLQVRTPPSKHDSPSPIPESSHGSSDKENVPPPQGLASTLAQQNVRNRDRNATRTSSQSLGLQLHAGFGSQQRLSNYFEPYHSTPRASTPSRGILEEKVSGLDDFVGLTPQHSDRADSPGMARRVDPMLQEYQDLGVSKVKAWKAAGNDGGQPRSAEEDYLGAMDYLDSRIQSETEPEDQFQELRHYLEDPSDEFGFLDAERKQKARKAAAAQQIHNESDDLHDEPDVPHSEPDELRENLPEAAIEHSDDVRLAADIFRMSSPPVSLPRTAEMTPVVEQKEATSSAPAMSPEETENKTRRSKRKTAATSKSVLPPNPPDVLDLEMDGVRMTRAKAKRLSTTADEHTNEAAGRSATYFASTSPAKRDRKQPSKKQKPASKTATASVPLKKTEKKEQKVLTLFIPSSSPSDSSPSSPFVTKTKKLNMEDVLSQLPLRLGSSPGKTTIRAKSTNGPKGRSKAGSSNGKARSRTESKGKGDHHDKASGKAKAKGKGKSRTQTVDTEEDELASTPKRSTRSTQSKGKRKAPTSSPPPSPSPLRSKHHKAGAELSPIHTDDSERTRRVKELRAIDKYQLNTEQVI